MTGRSRPENGFTGKKAALPALKGPFVQKIAFPTGKRLYRPKGPFQNPIVLTISAKRPA